MNLKMGIVALNLLLLSFMNRFHSRLTKRFQFHVFAVSSLYSTYTGPCKSQIISPGSRTSVAGLNLGLSSKYDPISFAITSHLNSRNISAKVLTFTETTSKV